MLEGRECLEGKLCLDFRRLGFKGLRVRGLSCLSLALRHNADAYMMPASGPFGALHRQVVMTSHDPTPDGGLYRQCTKMGLMSGCSIRDRTCYLKSPKPQPCASRNFPGSLQSSLKLIIGFEAVRHVRERPQA